MTTINASCQSISKNARIGRIKMPTQDEFVDIEYKLLLHLEEHKNITLLAVEETLKKELELLYKECENKLEAHNGQQRF